MRILEMTATFGCLNGQTLRLEDGVNTLVLPNESGKSTWAAFLLAMFYGIDSGERAAKGRLPVKVRYKPWSGAPMEGTVTLLWQGRRIVLQRTSEKGKPMGTFRAYDLDTGLEVPGLTGENCGRQLLGVEKGVFRRTAFLSGGELAVTQEQNLVRRLSNLAVSGSLEESYPAAVQRLKTWKNQLRYNNRGLLPEAEARLEQLRQNLRAAEALQAQKAAVRQQLEALERPAGGTPGLKEKDSLLGLLLLPVFLTGAAVCAGMKLWGIAGFMAAAALCCLAASFLNRRRNKKVRAAKNAEQDRERKIGQLRTEAAVLEARLEGLPSGAEMADLEQEAEELQFRERSLGLAMDALEQAQEELAQGYGPQLTACAGEVLGRLTCGRYDGMVLDRELNLFLRETETGLTRPLAALSRGTQDQAWLALRIAMTRLLLPPDAPVILDDALLTFDTERTAAAVKVLGEENRQVLVLSCRAL